VELTGDEEKHIRNLVKRAAVQGDKWPEHFAMALFADTPQPGSKMVEVET